MRADALEVVTGHAKYVGDIRLPNMLIGGVLYSAYPHAYVKAVRKDRALKVPGVEVVLSWEDIPQRWRGGIPPVVPILDKKVRSVGDAVALIAARTEEALEEAIELMEVDYEPLPPLLSVKEAKNGKSLLYEELGTNLLPLNFPPFGEKSLVGIHVGDVEKGFKEADVVVEGQGRYTCIPNPLTAEPPGVVAIWENPDKVTLFVSSQSPFRDKYILEQVFNGEIKVRVIGLRCGGSFGSRALSWRWYCFAILLSRATGKPVKMVMSKAEQLSTFVVRPSVSVEARIGMKRNGVLTAIEGSFLVDTGYYSRTTQGQIAVALGELQLMLRCPNWNLRGELVCTTRLPSGQVRGFGGQEFKCALLPIIWRGLALLDVDPFEFIKGNWVRPGDEYYWRDGKKYQYRGINFTKMMEAGAEKFGWREKWKGWLRPTEVKGSKRIGVGVSIHGNADVGEDRAEALVILYPNGQANIVGCIAEFGTGQTTNYGRMAAEVLGLPYEKVRVLATHSDCSPYIGPAGGSRGTYAIGSAVIRAAEKARRELLRRCACVLGVPEDLLDTYNGEVLLRNDPGRKWSWIQLLGNDWTIIGHGVFEPDYTLVNCMVTFVEVEVDVEAGSVKIRRVVNATDVGRVIDREGIEAQLNGCLGSGGLDSAVFEETVIDSSGRVLNSNLIDYKWRTFLELPDITNVILETPFPSHLLGAIGVGEITTSPGPSAVLMAVCNALARWIIFYPITPDRLLEEL